MMPVPDCFADRKRRNGRSTAPPTRAWDGMWPSRWSPSGSPIASTREVRAIAALNHPNICTIHDVGPNYLVMEYLDGSPVQGPLPAPKAIELARQIAAGLEAAHTKGVIHRDLKPANILVTQEGVKLLDFGLATLGHPTGASRDCSRRAGGRLDEPAPAAVSDDDAPTMAVAALTRAGDVMGTPAYMSPEQASGAPVDAKSDIFSFGVTLYEMLTGRRPFAAATQREMLAVISATRSPNHSKPLPRSHRLSPDAFARRPRSDIAA